jgi:hypothetical protein
MESVDLMMGSIAYKAYEASQERSGEALKEVWWRQVVGLTLARCSENYMYPQVLVHDFGQSCPTSSFTMQARVFNNRALIRRSIYGLEYTPRVCMGIDGGFTQGVHCVNPNPNRTATHC